MNTHADLDRRAACGRCGGCYLPDQDGDLFCLMCGRPTRRRRWEPAELEARLVRRAA